MIELTLAAPPTVNTYWRTANRGRGQVTYVSPRGKAYQKSVADAVIDAGLPRIEGRLSVWLGYAAPDRRSRDLDNICKASLDAMQKAGVYDDDSQIDELIVTRLPVKSGGELKVKICNTSS